MRLMSHIQHINRLPQMLNRLVRFNVRRWKMRRQDLDIFKTIIVMQPADELIEGCIKKIRHRYRYYAIR